MSRSSIFNFESLAGFRPRAPLALLATLVLLAAGEMASRAIPDNWLAGSRIHTEMRFMEEKLLPRFKQPRVLLLGSSRVRRAVIPAQLDAALSLPPNSTINAGMAMGRIYDGLYLYKRHRALFSGASVVVLAVDEWHFSSGWRLGTLYELEAPWSERLDFSGAVRSRLVLDGLFQMRLKLPFIWRGFIEKLGWRQPSEMRLSLTDANQVLPPERELRGEKTTPAQFREQLEAFYGDFEVSPVLLGQVAQLAEMVKADGGRFVLLQLPNRTGYQRMVMQLRGPEYRAYSQALHALAARLNAPLYAFEQPAECGLNDECYEDYGHINPGGAKIFTRFFADLIRPLIAAPRP